MLDSYGILAWLGNLIHVLKLNANLVNRDFQSEPVRITDTLNINIKIYKLLGDELCANIGQV